MGVLKTILIVLIGVPLFLIALPFLLIYCIIMSPWICSGSIIKHSKKEYGAPTRPALPPSNNDRHSRVQGYFLNDDNMSIFWTATLPPRGVQPTGLLLLIHGMGEYSLRCSYDKLRDQVKQRGMM